MKTNKSRTLSLFLSFLLIFSVPLATANASAPEAGDDGVISVFITLRGLDGDDDEEIWIDREPVKNVEDGATVSEIIIMALDFADYTQTGAESGYITSVLTPGGFELAVMHGGMPYSGWMFKVNDILPEVGMGSYIAEEGDHILLYFTKDFMAEFAFDGDMDDEGAFDGEAGVDVSDADGIDAGGALWESPFTDVSAGDWYYGDIICAYEAGLMLGTGEGVFSPGKPITRAMMATILYRFEGRPAVTHENPYTDVRDGEWYTDAVIWLYEFSVAMDISATGAEEFGIDEIVTREALMDKLFYYLTMKGADVPEYGDEPGEAGEPEDEMLMAPDAMDWARTTGLLPDTDDNITLPDAAATRAWTAAVFARLSEKV